MTASVYHALIQLPGR